MLPRSRCLCADCAMAAGASMPAACYRAKHVRGQRVAESFLSAIRPGVDSLPSNKTAVCLDTWERAPGAVASRAGWSGTSRAGGSALPSPLAPHVHVRVTIPQRLQSSADDRRRTRAPAQHGGPGARGSIRGSPYVGLTLPPKTPALKTAIKAERAAFDLKRSLQRLEVKDVETT